MWPLTKKSAKQQLQGHKTLRVNGLPYTIRRVNPLLDFSADNMPQIFASFVSKRKAEGLPEVEAHKLKEQMAAVLEAGIVTPALVAVGKGDKRGKEDGITVEDIMRDEDTAGRLYLEIMLHSLNRFRGLKSVFFSIRTRLLLYTAWQKSLEQGRPKLP